MKILEDILKLGLVKILKLKFYEEADKIMIGTAFVGHFSTCPPGTM